MNAKGKIRREKKDEIHINQKKILGLIVGVVVLCALAAFVALPLMNPAQSAQKPSGEIDFTVGGTSDCLRFLNSSVSTIYVPFTIAANENYQLTVNCTKMPGGANGWTDVYIYNGYWDEGTNHICKARDIYPIINDIQSVDFAIRADQPFTQTFGDLTLRSYTVFFVVPPGSQSAFHVTLKQL